MVDEVRKRRIAIVRGRDRYSDYDEYNRNKIVESITAWEEVTEEEFQALSHYAGSGDYAIYEQIEVGEVLPKSITEWKKWVERRRKEEEEYKKRKEAEREKKRAKEADKLRLKTLSSLTKEQQLAKLASELGVEIVGRDSSNTSQAQTGPSKKSGSPAG